MIPLYSTGIFQFHGIEWILSSDEICIKFKLICYFGLYFSTSQSFLRKRGVVVIYNYDYPSVLVCGGLFYIWHFICWWAWVSYTRQSSEVKKKNKKTPNIFMFWFQGSWLELLPQSQSQIQRVQSNYRNCSETYRICMGFFPLSTKTSVVSISSHIGYSLYWRAFLFQLVVKVKKPVTAVLKWFHLGFFCFVCKNLRWKEQELWR